MFDMYLNIYQGEGLTGLTASRELYGVEGRHVCVKTTKEGHWYDVLG